MSNVVRHLTSRQPSVDPLLQLGEHFGVLQRRVDGLPHDNGQRFKLLDDLIVFGAYTRAENRKLNRKTFSNGEEQRGDEHIPASGRIAHEMRPKRPGTRPA